MFWIALILLTFVINKLLLKITESYKRPIILPIALQSAYLLLAFFIGGVILWIAFDWPLDPIDLIRFLLSATGLIWFYQKPSYAPVIYLTLIHIVHTIMQYVYLLPDVEYIMRDFGVGPTTTFFIHSIFRIIVIWLMFSRLKKLNQNISLKGNDTQGFN